MENIAWVLGAIAVFLDICGGFLWSDPNKANTLVDGIQEQIDKFQETVDTAVEDAKKKIDEYATTVVATKVQEELSPERIELIEVDASPGWNVLDNGRTGPSFFKDQLGFVHLFGFLVPTDKFDPKNVFTLPPGFWPKETLQFPIACGEREDDTQLRTCSVTIRPDDGGVAAESFSKHWNSLNGVTFLTAPSKQD